jgi:zinc transporter 2
MQSIIISLAFTSPYIIILSTILGLASLFIFRATLGFRKYVDPSPDVEHTPIDGNLRRLKIAVCVCVVFFLVELAGGLYTGSLALLSDSTHLLTDCLTYSVGISSIYIGKWKAGNRFSLGYLRAEILGALLSTILIWACTIGLVVSAIRKLATPEPEAINNPKVMCLLAIVGLAVNILYSLHMFLTPRLLTLLQHEHHHDHHHESESTPAGDNINMRAAIIHALGDLICSGGVLLASIIILWKPEWIFIDSLCIFLFAIVILCTTYPVARDVFIVLMQGTPLSIDRSALWYLSLILIYSSFIGEIDGVTSVKWLHVSSLNMEKHILSVCLVLDRSYIDDEIARKGVAEVLEQEFKGVEFALVTIQTER